MLFINITMNENIYALFDDVFLSDFSIDDEGVKKTLDLGQYGKLETYSLFPGIVIAYIDIDLDNYDNMFVEGKLPSRLLEINHCFNGRYAYTVGDDRIIYFGKGDLCISVHEMTKTLSDFPLGFYNGIEIFIDIDIANEYIKDYIDFDLIEFYEELENSQGYVLVRSNKQIDHVIGELYGVDERIRLSYYKLKCLELLLFFSITKFVHDDGISLSKKQVEIVENVKKDLISDLETRLTIDELADKYGISKTTLKNCFKEVYGKPIYKWRKEYKLDYACKLIEEGQYAISEISKMVGYSSHSKFSQAFKEYVGVSPSDYEK